MTIATEPTVTMEGLRDLCDGTLDYAKTQGWATTRVVVSEYPDAKNPALYGTAEYETPAGVVIKRFAGRLSISCDMSELDDEAPARILSVDFGDKGDEPVAKEVISSHRGHTDKTIGTAQHIKLASELARYITLIV
ncbi:MAG TPA: hypothetical protein VFI84_03900 [Candidatus Saccharimonadales bacterium]|nr:hypothetical protein [Candidatus Saccharimonadales bacterium]